jgi:hypothetical protein
MIGSQAKRSEGEEKPVSSGSQIHNQGGDKLKSILKHGLSLFIFKKILSKQNLHHLKKCLKSL